MRDDLLILDGISRQFGSTIALDDVSFRLRAGTVHALLGENGAGKTTLMRIAFGMLRADSGALRVKERDMKLVSPSDALAHGIGMVHQHFTLVPTMTVAENVALGGAGRFDPERAASRVRDIATRTGLPVDPHAVVESLSVSAQQRVEIIKALSRDIRVLILDEPTALLAPTEGAELLRWVRTFAQGERAVVLITHKLRDALSVADDFTVLRRGRRVLSAARDAVDESTLSSAMIGSAPSDSAVVAAVSGSTTLVAHAADSIRTVPSRPNTSHISAAAGISPTTHTSVTEPHVVASLDSVSLRDDRGVDRLHEITLELRRGEVVGIAAIEGAGQHALLRVLAGRLAPSRGVVRLPDRIGFIPEDRHRDALMLDEPLVANIALHDAHTRRGRLRWHAMRQSTLDVVQRFDVRTPGVDVAARLLSGGNQQKLVAGRELIDAPPLVVAENPTRGLDFSATAALHRALREARALGTAVVVYSSDLDEVLAIADRVLVMRGGRVFDVSADRDLLGRAMLDAS